MRTKPILAKLVIKLTPQQSRRINRAFVACAKNGAAPGMIAMEPFCKKHPRGGTMTVNIISPQFSDMLAGCISYAKSQSE